MSERKETPAETLARIQSGFSKNDLVVVEAFAAAGVDPADIAPRENVLTFNAWKATDRRVAKGAKSLRVTVYVPKRGGSADDADDNGTDENGKKKRGGMIPKTARLFHVSQTVAIDGPKGTKPAAWNNPALIREGTYAEAEQEAETAGV
jgi:hypothetical protein